MIENDKPLVLIVEDQRSWRDLLVDLLTNEYNITTADSYTTALEMVLDQDLPFHVIITDIRLKDYDEDNEQGLDFLAKLSKLKYTKSIVVTGYATVNNVMRALMDIKVFGFIEKKPANGKRFDIAKFRKIVRAAADAAIEQQRILREITSNDGIPIGIQNNSVKPNRHSDRVDLAVVTALPEELDPVLNLLGGREHWRRFEHEGYIHYSAQFPCDPCPLTVVACSLWKYGGNPTTAQVLRLKPLQPRLIVMTGICAAWQAKDIQLGDIIVADRAFHAGEGKQSATGFEPDTRTYQPPPWLLQWLKDFSRQEEWSTDITTPRPRSLRYQAEWLLCQLAEQGAAFPVTDADWTAVRENCPDYARIRKLLQDQKLLSKIGKLTSQARKELDTLRQQHYGHLLPIPDQKHPTVHYNALASVEAVMAVGNPFEEPAQRVRSVGAIELEIASLFAAATEIGVPAFAVKGVSDYGTPTKDDAFHAYAAEAAARWMYAFVCDYATLLDERLPRHNLPAKTDVQ